MSGGPYWNSTLLGLCLAGDKAMSDPTGKDLAKAQAVIKELLNPEPHPFQKEWSEAHSMSIEQLINRICDALATERAEAIAKTKEKAAISLLKPFISGTPMATFIRQRMKEIRDLTEAEIMGKEKAHE